MSARIIDQSLLVTDAVLEYDCGGNSPLCGRPQLRDCNSFEAVVLANDIV